MGRHPWLRALFIACFVLAGCFSLDIDGDGDLDIPPHGGDEQGPVLCANGRDDDLDGRIDCEDSDCLMGGHCGEQIPLLPPAGYENTFDTCSNGIDDDEDGQFDCGDRGCQNIFELCCLLEFDDASCSNLLDDDGNGFADCADFSCRNNPYVTACDAERNCTDARDNDGDRYVDCRDTDCADDPACDERDCADRVDNDGDGLTDCADPACADVCPREQNCVNNIDDNANDLVDCFDPDCYMDAACLGAEDTLEACSDGNDNDGNNYTDCADFSCSRSTDAMILAYCESISESTLARCMDGIDNDGNGFTDCNDFSCSRSTDMAVTSYCASIGENTLERCMDGRDNDGNGFTDCNDFSCSRSSDAAVVQYCRNIGEANFAACRDRVDNDGNGFTDCADFSCRFSGIAWGTHFCATDADCESGRPCVDIGNLRVCEQLACTAGDNSTCPTGLTCVTTTGTGGSRSECAETCASHDDCRVGSSCYRGQCLAVTAPCFETVAIDENTDLQGNEGGAFPTDTTIAEQQAMVWRACTDGIDGDGDGFTDCEDWECNHDPRAINPNTGQPVCRYARGRTCVIGPNAGQACSSDADCGALSGACGPAGVEGQVFVCP